MKRLSIALATLLFAIPAFAQVNNPGVTKFGNATALDVAQWANGSQITGQGRTFTTNSPNNFRQTWNNAGVTFSLITANLTDTASASASTFLDLQLAGTTVTKINKTGSIQTIGGGTVSDPFIRYTPANTNGIYFPTDGAMRFVTTTTDRADVTAQGIGLRSDGTFNWAVAGIGGVRDLVLARDAANTLAQRNGTAAQLHNIYRTYTDASNYERLAIGASGTSFQVAAAFAGTGLRRDMLISAQDIGFTSGGTGRWLISGSTGHFTAQLDNTYDIGASGATRPRTGYFGTDVQAGANIAAVGTLRAGSSSSIGFTSRSIMTSTLNGVVTFSDNAGTDFTLMSFGGGTSAYPGIKRFGNSTALRAANDTVPTFATLTTCAAGGEGALSPVSDSLTAIWGATITGGGANHVLAYCNGTNWTVN